MFKRLMTDAPKLRANSLEDVYGFYCFHVGKHEIIVINDGFIGLPLSLLEEKAVRWMKFVSFLPPWMTYSLLYPTMNMRMHQNKQVVRFY